jgi:hypothetical protein
MEAPSVEHAYEKVSVYKGRSWNHLLSQVTGFRIGVQDKDSDLLDAWVCPAATRVLGLRYGPRRCQGSPSTARFLVIGNSMPPRPNDGDDDEEDEGGDAIR